MLKAKMLNKIKLEKYKTKFKKMKLLKNII